MDIERIRLLLEAVKAGDCSPEQALDRLKILPFESLEFACLDHHRLLRTGFPEVVYGESKTTDQLTAILERMLQINDNSVMATRISPDKAKVITEAIPTLIYHEHARILTSPRSARDKPAGKGTILVLTAGTSDIPVAEEAVVTAQYLGNKVDKLYDVGVAGIHRLLINWETIRSAAVLIVVAGMEGALPSVVAGIVARPVVAVPTSIGYGVGKGGMAAIMAMLNSCSPGIAVVNIDNGFGAGCFASLINQA